MLACQRPCKLWNLLKTASFHCCKNIIPSSILPRVGGWVGLSKQQVTNLLGVACSGPGRHQTCNFLGIITECDQQTSYTLTICQSRWTSTEQVEKNQGENQASRGKWTLCNDSLVVKVNCWSYVFNIIQSIWILKNIKDKKIAEKSV